ncbi:MAG: peptidylprolyl isomerase, partial [Candidatus Dadabacteria bacterium]|nr:peptidylprolyl isomerase [Candidatus Dadabacteria bacterium]
LHVKGAVGMARTSDEVNPERISSGSQFYVCLDDVHRLDNKYTVFGNVVRGMDVVMELRAGDTIEKIRVRKVSKHFEEAVAEEIERLSKIDLETDMPYEDLKALVKTNKGEFTMKFFHDTAPKHVENFIKLTRDGFYDGLTWHRYVQGFVIQGGDPEGSGSGGPGYTIPAEISPKHNHVKGAVGMARTGDDVNPERASSGSQFYICLAGAPHLNGGYTVWAEVVAGMENVLLLREKDTIESIEIVPDV